MLLIAVLLGIIGTILFIRGLARILSIWAASIKHKATRGLYVFTLRQLHENVVNKYISISVASILMMLTIMLITDGSVRIMSYGSELTRGTSVYDFTVMGNDQIVEKYLSNEQIRPYVSNLNRMEIGNIKSTASDGISSPVDWSKFRKQIVQHLPQDVVDPATQEDGMYSFGSDQPAALNLLGLIDTGSSSPYLLPVSSYNRLLDAAGEKQISLGNNEVVYYLNPDFLGNDKRSLKAAFYTAILDDCIRKIPFDFQLNTVIEDDTEPKVPLTPAQEESFLSFAQNDKVYQKYYDELIILLGTGLRISELCGLTDTDINFENRIINVDHQLLRSAETGYYIETPKTKSGIRQIPMSEKVYEAFNRVLKRRRGAKAVTIDGYSNFLFLNRDGYPKTATNYDGMFRGLAKKYNKYHEEALPKVMTPHTLRHTFCTNMANAGMNPKALQYIMGHSNITMTLNYYAHATFDSAKAEMLRIAA